MFFTSAVYPDKAYIMNLDMHETRRVQTKLAGRSEVLELKPLEIKEVAVRREIK